MSPEALTGIFTLGGVAVGAVGSIVSERFLYRRQRDDALNDRLYRERSSAYITFLQAAHECAHGLGKLALHTEYIAPHRALPSPDKAEDLGGLPDAFAAKHVRVVEMVGPAEVAQAATSVQGALYGCRNKLMAAYRDGVSIEQWSDAYREQYGDYRDARVRFTEVAKTHLARLSARSDAAAAA